MKGSNTGVLKFFEIVGVGLTPFVAILIAICASQLDIVTKIIFFIFLIISYIFFYVIFQIKILQESIEDIKGEIIQLSIK